MVFLELKRRYTDVFVGKVGDLEVDFVAMAPDGPVYYQVAETVSNEKTLERELKSLEAIRDNHPKILLTKDDVDPVSHGGIKQKSVLDWLLEG